MKTAATGQIQERFLVFVPTALLEDTANGIGMVSIHVNADKRLQIMFAFQRQDIYPQGIEKRNAKLTGEIELGLPPLWTLLMLHNDALTCFEFQSKGYYFIYSCKRALSDSQSVSQFRNQ